MIDVVRHHPSLVYFSWNGQARDVYHAMYPRMQAYVSRRHRMRIMVRHRQAVHVHRDARLVFRAAAEGRPLELQKRLVLGVLGGALHETGMVHGVPMTAMEAAAAGGHEECEMQLRRSQACQERRLRLLMGS